MLSQWRELFQEGATICQQTRVQSSHPNQYQAPRYAVTHESSCWTTQLKSGVAILQFLDWDQEASVGVAVNILLIHFLI